VRMCNGVAGGQVRAGLSRILAAMAERTLVQVEMRFVTEGDPGGLADRVRESVALIVGRDRLEEFRVRTMPLSSPKRLRPVD
jgi:hypothetical protein